MKLPFSIRQFGLRIALCVVVVGGLYLIVHGVHRHQQNASASAIQELAAMRASLDENYIAGTSLHSFKRSDVQAYLALNDLFGQYKSSNDSLVKQLKSPSKLLTPAQKNQFATIASRQQQSRSELEARLKILSQIIQYDPGQDLKGSIDSKASILAGRARAAQRGLNKAASDQTASSSSGSLNVDNENGPSLLVTSTTKAALVQQAGCFGRLAEELDGHIPAATATRSQCVSGYPAVRALALQNIITPVFDKNYQAYTESNIPSLLRQLDATIKAQN
jgi:hypothetical protein